MLLERQAAEEAAARDQAVLLAAAGRQRDPGTNGVAVALGAALGWAAAAAAPPQLVARKTDLPGVRSRS